MNTCITTRAILVACALAGLASTSVVSAQTTQGNKPASQGDKRIAIQPSSKAPSPPGVTTVATASPAAAATAVAPTTLVAAAGSLMHITNDGRVTKSAYAQIHSPAPGFVFER